MSQSLKHNSSNNQLEVKGSEVFVGGLPRTITEDKINEVFSTCGEILEIRLIKDEKGSLKGFCFVRFSTKAAADKAVKEKSGLLLDGKKIGVLPSVDQDTLFLGNLYKGWSADEFDILVRQVFPDVVSVDLAMPSSSGETPPGQKKQNRGFAFLKFSSHAAAARALRASSSPAFLLGGKLHPAVDWAQEERQVDPEELAKIKIAFVRNLPAGADETFLKQLFVPLGKVEKVVLSKNARYLVGFVHFANRSELDDAIKEMNGKTVQGPNGGPSVKLQVEVARPMDKSKKRVREEPQTKQSSTITSQSKHGRIDQTTFNAFGVFKATAQQEPVATDPYEAAVVLLPVAIKERLLRILRLGIATRFDIDIECLTSLRELPESTAISVLDQFMLSGAEKHNKGAFLTGLISRHQVDKLGLYGFPPSSLSRLGDIPRKESGLPSFSSRGAHLPAFDPISSHVGLTTVRSDGPTSRYPSVYSDYPLSSRASFGRIQDASPGQASFGRIQDASPGQASFGRIQDASPLSHLHQTPGPSTPYGKVGLDSYLTAAAADRQTSRPQVVLDSHFTGAVDRQILRPPVGLDSHLTGAADRQSSRSQVRFDPFTGQPYKFDPFTGEPIRPESPPRHFRSPY